MIVLLSSGLVLLLILISRNRKMSLPVKMALTFCTAAACMFVIVEIYDNMAEIS